ncbi:hypothetical protein F4604DRAFT_1901059 [Suillus subluteus]|nr:hypothetical protein F4604DRAFT_1901059 [Suillus subluteus]
MTELATVGPRQTSRTDDPAVPAAGSSDLPYAESDAQRGGDGGGNAPPAAPAASDGGSGTTPRTKSGLQEIPEEIPLPGIVKKTTAGMAQKSASPPLLFPVDVPFGWDVNWKQEVAYRTFLLTVIFSGYTMLWLLG